jgi:Domain of unknown function (DUF4836)
MMHRHMRNALLVFLAAAFFSACNRIPDHARFIPKDAVTVAGLNFKVLGKKIAWNVITGSKLFKEMQDRIPQKNSQEAVNSIDKSGIDFSSTLYVYVKSDTRFKGGNRITGIIPIADAGQWEAYVKKSFPKVEIKQHGDRKEASLSEGMFVGWTKNLMIVINAMPETPDYTAMATGNTPSADKPALDMASISAEMDNAFGVTKENSIISNKHFTSLEEEGHDFTFWVNYDELMTKMSGGMAEKMGMSLSSNLWKDAAFCAGVDFKKGKISGDMRYYMSSEMKAIGTEMGATNADKDMIESLPKDNLDMLIAIHMAPKGIKDMLEKMNMLGLINIGLSTQGMTVDNVLDAFTGDMALVMNDFSLKTEKVTDSFMGQAITHQKEKPNLNMSYVIKINNKSHFDKIMKLAKDNGLKTTNGGFIIPLTDKDSVYILINDHYAVASNKLASATGILNGTFKANKYPETVSTPVMGHPWAMYFDIQQLLKNIDPGMGHSLSDSLMIVESKKLLNNVSFNGGSFKDNAFEYHLDINFMNTEENSIIELMDYGMKMSEANKKEKKDETKVPL